MGYDNYITFALDIVAQADIVLTFPDKAGAQARFGYYRGRWVLVTAGSREYDATNVARTVITDALQTDLDAVVIRQANRDRPWQWFVERPQSGADAMVASHCTCGAFKCSTNTNRVLRWRRTHDDECAAGDTPSMQYPDNE